MRYISAVADNHHSNEDDVKVLDVFLENSENGDKVSKDKAQLAYERIFELWQIDLTGQQETEFFSKHFEPLWNEYAKDSMFPETP